MCCKNVRLLQALREAVPKLEKLAAAAKPGLTDASTVRALATAWTAVTKVHAVNTHGKETVIFPELEGFFPGQVCKFGRSVEDELMQKLL